VAITSADRNEYASRDVQNMITKLSTYETLLSDLLPSLDLEKQQAIRNTLAELVCWKPSANPCQVCCSPWIERLRVILQPDLGTAADRLMCRIDPYKTPSWGLPAKARHRWTMATRTNQIQNPKRRHSEMPQEKSPAQSDRLAIWAGRRRRGG